MSVRVSVKNLTKTYGQVAAIANLSLEVRAGEVMGLLGPNGAGKSTTLSIMAGLTPPTAGSVRIFKKELRRNHVDIMRRVGVLLERPAFFDYLSVRRNLKIHARLAGHEGNLDRALDVTGMLHVADKRAGSLSQGMRQRFGLALAMLTEPEVLLLDEPTAGLDPESTQELLTHLRRLAVEAGVTIVFSSHLMHEVELLCDRVAVINRGRLVACEQVESLISYDLGHVEVLLEGAEGAARRLRDQPWVAGVEVKPGRLIVRLDGGTPHHLNHFLLSAGYQVSGLIPRRRTLREFFLKAMNA